MTQRSPFQSGHAVEDDEEEESQSCLTIFADPPDRTFRNGCNSETSFLPTFPGAICSMTKGTDCTRTTDVAPSHSETSFLPHFLGAVSSLFFHFPGSHLLL